MRNVRVEKVKINVQLHGIPPEAFVLLAAIKVANMAGEIIDVDIQPPPTVHLEFLRATMWIVPDEPLITGFYVDL